MVIHELVSSSLKYSNLLCHLINCKDMYMFQLEQNPAFHLLHFVDYYEHISPAQNTSTCSPSASDARLKALSFK